jgi:hypothetical protein
MKFTLFKRIERAAPQKRTSLKTRIPESAFHAVDIVTQGRSCEAAKALDGVRFLSREQPPQLPLGNCEFPERCVCKYRHHEDRRKELRRHTDHAWQSAAPLPANRERRRLTDRRASDRETV